VTQCQIAGSTVHMRTEDHIMTATSIAKDVGILDDKAENKPDHLVMAAADFDKVSEAEIDEMKTLPLVQYAVL
jgi:Na+-exporting ATPase